MADPFGRAIRDFHLGEQDEPLVRYDGDDIEREHPIERFYFGERAPDSASTAYLERWLDGPLLDMGAGVGRDARYFQERFETVAVEASEHLVETMRDRGVEDARLGDMFALRESFGRDRFRSALTIGTQLGLGGSLRGVRAFLGDLAHVTTDGATAVLDNYDPRHEEVPGLVGHRRDPTPGMAYRVFHFEYEGDVGEELLFRLFSPDRLREACVGTGWDVAAVRGGAETDRTQYRAALRKR